MEDYVLIHREDKAAQLPVSAWTVATLSFIATTSLVVLLRPLAGDVALFSKTVPHVAALRATLGLQPALQQTGTPAVVPLSNPQHATDFALTSNNHDASVPQRSTQKVAGFALGAVVVSVLAIANRFRAQHPAHRADTALNTAVLDPPATQEQATEVYNKGIVSAEEGLNLPFTMADLRNAIPERCFEKSLAWSMFYFARDWAIVAALYYFQPTFFGLGILGKVVWWNVVGFYGWCLFVTGHDCGHGSFSNYGWLNQLLGHVCHAPLLVPFNGWRISHRAHHQYHNDVDRDHSWRPSVANALEKLSAPIRWVRFTPLILLAYPYYLISNSHENGFSGCHFWPWNPLFKKEERMGIVCSALAVLGWAGVLAAATMKFGAMAVFQSYWIPYMIFVCWLDLVTLMQHTDKNALFFRGEAWNYLRGAMSTIDRTYRHLIDPFNLGYGRIIDHLHHHISDGHVVHHIFFTQIPHYRLMEATEAIKPILGKHYRYDDTPILKAFYSTLRDCWFVDDIDSGVVTYKGEKEFREWERKKAVQSLA